MRAASARPESRRSLSMKSVLNICLGPRSRRCSVDVLPLTVVVVLIMPVPLRAFHAVEHDFAFAHVDRIGRRRGREIVTGQLNDARDVGAEDDERGATREMGE